jgi:hypothetical protein
MLIAQRNHSLVILNPLTLRELALFKKVYVHVPEESPISMPNMVVCGSADRQCEYLVAADRVRRFERIRDICIRKT